MASLTETKRIESKQDIETFLARLKYAIETKSVRFYVEKDRYVEKKRDEKYSNRYTLSRLFPDEDEAEVLKRELASLCPEEYIETVKDTRYPKKSEMRAFGRKYDEDVYIKIRVELVSWDHASGEHYIFVMSFHYSTGRFKACRFPYRKG